MIGTPSEVCVATCMQRDRGYLTSPAHRARVRLTAGKNPVRALYSEVEIMEVYFHARVSLSHPHIRSHYQYTIVIV